MGKKNSIDYAWNEKDGIATCIIRGDIRGRVREYVGTAHVHPEDEDMKSELVGCEIAEYRANIELMKDYLVNELEPGLAALKQLYYSMKHSSQFSPKGYEAKMLYRQIRLKEEDIEFIKQEIAKIKQFIKYYINRKDQNYQHIRKKRNSK